MNRCLYAPHEYLTFFLFRPTVLLIFFPFVQYLKFYFLLTAKRSLHWLQNTRSETFSQPPSSWRLCKWAPFFFFIEDKVCWTNISKLTLSMVVCKLYTMLDKLYLGHWEVLWIIQSTSFSNTVCVTERDLSNSDQSLRSITFFQRQLLPQPALAQIIHTNTSFEHLFPPAWDHPLQLLSYSLPSKSDWPFPVRPLSYVVVFFNPDLFTGNFNTHWLSSSAFWNHPLQLLFLWRHPLANLQYFTVRPFYVVVFLMLTFYTDIFHPLLLRTSSFLVDLSFWTVVQRIPGLAIDDTTLTNRSLDDQVINHHIINEPHHCTVPQPHPLYCHMAFLVCVLSALMGWVRSTLWVVMSVHLSNSVT